MINKEKNKKKHKSLRSKRLPLILSLTRRAVLFLTIVLTAQFLFFIMGNLQNFLDSNIILILYLIVFSAILHAFFCTAAVIECIYYVITKKKVVFTVHLIVFFILLMASVVTAVFASSIITLTDGIGTVQY